VIVDRDAPCGGACRVLVADKIAAEGVARLEQAAQVDVATGLSESQLVARIPEYHALVVRSQTQVTEPVIAAGRRLKVIGRAGVGVDNIDVAAATRHGVIVVNSPEGNTIAAAEHTIAMLLALSRRIPDAMASVRAGLWGQRNRFIGVEIYNKALGVIGLGKIGREVARRARGLGMQVLGSDVFVSAEQAKQLGVELVELPELIQRSDYITVHTPLTRETRGMLGDEQFAQMKRGVRLINCARGGIIDEDALQRALDAGIVAGAALDVFSEEPPPADLALLKDERVIVTPHLGASTEEAQVNVALDVAEEILAVLDGRPPRSAVNMPAVSAEVYARIEPYLRLGDKIGRLHAQLADSPIRGVQISYSGDILNLELQPVTRAVLVGLLQPEMAESVNFVNAPFVAESRGIRVTESKTAGDTDYANLIEVTVDTLDRPGRQGRGRHVVSGTVHGRRAIRIQDIDEFHLDVVPEGHLLLATYEDRPGIVGLVGTLLGQHDINIAGMHVGRQEQRGRALMVLNLDDAVPEALLSEMAAAIKAESVRLVEL
jgi:D-3-phosphoglycerate dehydrogenase / 2-oxoglutarate reductase